MSSNSGKFVRSRENSCCLVSIESETQYSTINNSIVRTIVMPATSTTEGQPKTILGEEAHGTQMTAPDTAGAGGPQFTESDNKDIHRYIIKLIIHVLSMGPGSCTYCYSKNSVQFKDKPLDIACNIIFHSTCSHETRNIYRSVYM